LVGWLAAGCRQFGYAERGRWLEAVLQHAIMKLKELQGYLESLANFTEPKVLLEQ